MFTVQCPQCQSKLKLKSAVTNARMKCPKCSTVFVGSTTTASAPADPLAELAGQTSGARPATPGQAQGSDAGKTALENMARQRTAAQPVVARYRPRQKTPMWQVGLAIGSLVGFIIVLGLALYFGNTTVLEINDPQTGKTVSLGRMWKSDAEAKSAEYMERRKAEIAAANAANQATAATGASGGGEVKINVDKLPGDAFGSSKGTIKAGEKYESGEIAAPETKGDTNITTVGIKPLPGSSPTSGHMTGKIHSKYTVPLKSVDLTITIFDTNNKQIGQAKGTVKNVAPEGTMMFSAPYTIRDDTEIGKTELAATAVKDEGTLGGWDVDQAANGKPAMEDNQIVMELKTKNVSGAGLSDMKLYVDFFTSEGQYAGTAEGKLIDDLASLKNGETAHFKVTFKPSEAVLIDVVHDYSARLIGKKF